MEHTAVMLMPYVTIPGDPITVRAKMDFMVMAKPAMVTIKKLMDLSCHLFQLS